MEPSILAATAWQIAIFDAKRKHAERLVSSAHCSRGHTVLGTLWAHSARSCVSSFGKRRENHERRRFS